MAETVRNLEGITFNDLYELYPDFYIDIVREQQLLQLHDIIVWHHPFYWYSAPSLMKEWFDLVLQHGFAYGERGRALEGKTAFSVISTGGRKEVYAEKGRNNYPIRQFLIPYKQSAALCRMNYLPPYVVHGSHTIGDAEIHKHAEQYKKLLILLRDEKINEVDVTALEYLNDIIEKYV